MTETLVTRFAPSPTGRLHIGGVRTALFNWAYAKKRGGRFILRIEDTDQVRSGDDALRDILESLQWLGLDWQEGPDPFDPHHAQRGSRGPYLQSQRLDLYREQLRSLFDAGRAYKCFKTPQELDAERDAAKREKRTYRYDPTQALNRTAEEVRRLEAQGLPCVVRFRMPDTDVTFHDEVFGPITIKREELEDFIILKADKFPTFHLAVTVDDALMGVTHVIRGQDHLYNTAKHVALFDALGYPRPSYTHLPLIFNPDGSKMSKRDKAKAAREAAKQAIASGASPLSLWERQGEGSITGDSDPLPASPKGGGAEAVLLSGFGIQAIESFLAKENDDLETAVAIAARLNVALPEIDVADFRRSGYLPEVLLSYLSQLGWSHGSADDRYGVDYVVEHFDLPGVSKSNAKFDRDKLAKFNQEAISAMPPGRFVQVWREYCQRYEPVFIEKLGESFAAVAASYQPRARTLAEPCENGRFFVLPDDALVFDPKALEKVLAKGDGYAMLRLVRDTLAHLESWTPGDIHAALEKLAAEKGVGLGKLAQPLRVAVTGSTVSPPIDQTLAILGKASVMTRIQRCLEAHVP